MPHRNVSLATQFSGFLSIFILDPIGKVRYNRNVHTYNNILIDLTVNIVLSFDRAILNFDCFKCKQFIIFFYLVFIKIC